MRTRREGSSGLSGSRKRVRCNEKKSSDIENPKRRRLSRRKNIKIYNQTYVLSPDSENIGITSIPFEMLSKILSYLDHSDLRNLQKVSKFFENLPLEPTLWTAYKVKNDQTSTSDVIAELKRMPHLRKISIEARNDCDDILRQLSCSNKRLQKLFIVDCTGSTANLYLRPGYLTKILQRCSKLHTIAIRGSRFRGSKFYRLLGEMGHRLKFVSASATCMQFRTFAKHVSNLDERDREALCAMCRIRGNKWSRLRYYMVERSDRSKTALISYLYQDFFNFDMRRTTCS